MPTMHCAWNPTMHCAWNHQTRCIAEANPVICPVPGGGVTRLGSGQGQSAESARGSSVLYVQEQRYAYSARVWGFGLPRRTLSFAP